MSKKPEFEIQKATYTRLNGNINCKIYDEVPQDAKYPYVEFGTAITVDGSLKDCNLRLVTVTFDGWDRWGSNMQIIDIMSDVVETMTVSGDGTSSNFLSLTNFTVVNQFDTGMTILKDLDARFRHVIQTMEIWCHQN